jgi:hypothetical protein
LITAGFYAAPHAFGFNPIIVCQLRPGSYRKRCKIYLTMAKARRARVCSREAVSEMPEWLKDKNCPHKKKYVTGERFQPQNLTSRETLTGRMAFFFHASTACENLWRQVLLFCIGVYEV